MKQNPFSLYDFLGYIIPGLFFIFSIFIIDEFKKTDSISFFPIINSFPTLKLEGSIFILIVSYTLGHLLSFVPSITIEKFGIWKYGYPSKYLLGIDSLKYKDHLRKNFPEFIWGLILFILLLPIAIFDYILGKLFGFKDFYRKPVDDLLVKAIELKVNQLAVCFGLTKVNGFENGIGDNNDFFRIVQHYTYDHSLNHQSKFTNYVALYGFLRTMTLIMMILFWYIIVHVIIIGKFGIGIVCLLGIASLIPYIFFMAYMKFYRRYTLEGFMVLVIDKDIKDIKC